MPAQLKAENRSGLLHVQLGPRLHAAVLQEARRQDRAMSSLVRIAMRQYLTENGADDKTSEREAGQQ